jgi:hypothetical protein
MAPKVKKEEVSTSKGRIKFRYTDPDRTMEFTIENMAGEGVREALHSLGSAIAGRALEEPKRLRHVGAPTSAAETTDDDEIEDTEPADSVDPREDSEGEEFEPAPPKLKRVAKPKAPKVLPSPVLTGAKSSLEDFMKKKNPEDMMDKYAVVAVWYKEEFQVTEISIDHIFTAFKHLGIESQLPTDIAKPLQNLVHGRKWFEAGKDKGTYTINWIGESEVGKMGVVKAS